MIQLLGHSIITGKKYEIEMLRCNLCGERFSPSLPNELGDGKKYAPSARSALAIGRYYLERVPPNKNIIKMGFCC